MTTLKYGFDRTSYEGACYIEYTPNKMIINQRKQKTNITTMALNKLLDMETATAALDSPNLQTELLTVP